MACPALHLPGPCSRCQRHTSSFFDDGTACPSSSVLNGGGLSPARRRQRAVIPELDCRTEPQSRPPEYRRRHTCEHLAAGEALELVREHTDTKSVYAVSYYHRAVHFGYVPKLRRWTMDFVSRLLSKISNPVEFSVGAQNSSARASSFSADSFVAGPP